MKTNRKIFLAYLLFGILIAPVSAWAQNFSSQTGELGFQHTETPQAPLTNFSNSTSCEYANIRCLEDGELEEICGVHAGACAVQSTCTIYLSDYHTCGSLELENATYLISDLQWTMMYGSCEQPICAENRCMLLHELRHLLDNDLKLSCEREQTGHYDQRQCLQHYHDQQCSDTSEEEGWTPGQCTESLQNLCKVEVAQSFNACRCRERVGNVGEPCPDCKAPCEEELNECYADNGLEPDPAGAELYCEQLEETYCYNTEEL